MNYEQKYKEALERARDSFTYPDYPGFIRADVVFPELKESQDERIRKEIIAIFEGKIPFTSEEDSKRYIAWLEKLKVFAEHGDGLYYFGDNGFTYIGNPTCDNVSCLEKQGKKGGD